MKNALACRFILIIIWAAAQVAFANAENTSTSTASSTATDTGTATNAETNSDVAKDTDVFIPKIDDLFKNKAVLSGLESGAVAINHSVDTLMEALFYRLLDNEFRNEITGGYWFANGLARSIFSTSQGGYVVVDRVRAGPQYERQFAEALKIPLKIGGAAGVEMMDIYLRSSAQRLAEERSLPFWRYAVNNWFGILPVLTQILPPSFNPNALYDPLRQIETPFVFPSDKAAFRKMPVGSIRSYSITGGIRFPFDLDTIWGQKLKDALARYEIDFSLPYSVFVEGTHRVNVLRKSDDVAWVGLTKIKDVGHSLIGLIGKTYYILSNALTPIPWNGIPSLAAPIDINLTQKIVDQMDQLYEFDLRNPKAEAPYLKAIAGDFVLARNASKQTSETGVRYHFTKETIATSKEADTANRFVLLYKQEKKRIHTKAEIQIRDETGVFSLLESAHEYSDNAWDIFTGQFEENVKNQVDLNVEQVPSKNPGKVRYIFHRRLTPYQVAINFQIKDQHASIREYNEYVDRLEYLTKIPLDSIPRFPIRVDADVVDRRNKLFFASPDEVPLASHISSSSLGQFNANAQIIFSYQEIQHILSASRNEILAAFLAGYGYENSATLTEAEVGTFGDWAFRILTFPLRMLNTKIAIADAPFEVLQRIVALENLKLARTPTRTIRDFNRLFDTDYPLAFIDSLYRLAHLEKIPRRVSFFINPDNHLPDKYKDKVRGVNNRSLSGGSEFPKNERYNVAESKLKAFYPSQVQEQRPTPHVKNIKISRRALQHRSSNNNSNFLYIDFLASDLLGTHPEIYVKLEKYGKLQIGNYLLAEQIIDRVQFESPRSDKLHEFHYGFYLSGPASMLSNFILEKTLGFGGDFQLSLSVADSNGIWSEFEKIIFRYENGNVSILDKE